MNTIAQKRDEVVSLWHTLQSAGAVKVQIMEVCGTHTVAISRSGLRDLLPPGVRLISGPGCPVCVTDQSYMDACVHMSHLKGVIVASYGDMLRVPGKLGSLEKSRSEGSEVAVVYSALDAVALACQHPDKHVVFLGIGFETTAPATALALKRAKELNVKNFSVFSAHKLVLPVMLALLPQKDLQIDAFLCPGHVSVILGYRAYEPVAKTGRPCVVAGFEDMQIMLGLVEILRELVHKEARTCTIYPPVTEHGNKLAQEVIHEVFRIGDAAWRALGVVPGSGLVIRDEYAEWDTEKRFEVPKFASYEMPGCRCGDVICGRKLPPECPLFGKVCTPRNPVGPCMVSSEGSCAAYYRYHWRGGKTV
jgi:hydrogenase expression/formation protein HypD